MKDDIFFIASFKLGQFQRIVSGPYIDWNKAFNELSLICNPQYRIVKTTLKFEET